MASRDTARLDFLIDNEARVGVGIGGFCYVWKGPSDDPENMEPFNSCFQTEREAIDAAMTKKERPHTCRNAADPNRRSESSAGKPRSVT
jgi:hypothetical protein